MKDLVLVTGATRGIGKAICEKFLSLGYQVVGLARTAADLPWPVVGCDLSDSESIDTAFGKVVAGHGVPKILVNNAGIYFALPWDQESLEQFDLTMGVNARAVFQLSRLFAAKLIDQGQRGAIVNVTSISGRIGSVDPAYAASKAAADALTKSFARSLADRGIRVNAVAPGPTETDMGATIPRERKRQYTRSILAGRFGEPREIASLVVFLAGEEASFITGEVMYATGGIL